MGAHDFKLWLGEQVAWLNEQLAKLNGASHIDSGWQRNPPAQNTDSIRIQPLDVIGDVAGGRPWPGAPGTWRAVYMHEQPHRRRGDTPVPATHETGGIRRVEQPAPRKIVHTGRLVPMDISDLDTGKPVPGLPHWMVAQTPISAGDLPVQRLKPVSAATEDAQESANYVALDDMLTTMRPLPLFMGFSADTNVVPDLPTEPRKPEDVDAWLNSATLPPLADLPSGALAVADKTNGNPLGVTEADCAPDLEDGAPTALHERTVRNNNFMQAISGLLDKEGGE